MSKALKTLLALAALVALAASPFGASARAGSFTFSTPANSTAGGEPVNAQVDFTTSDGILTIVLTNLQANPTSVIQALSDLSFTIDSGTLDGATLSSSSAQEISIDGSGNATLGGTVATGWIPTLGGTSGLLDVLAGGGAGPSHLIIGPGGPGGVYTNANGSIAGNGPHNPFLNQSATFTITGEGITADTTITGAIFSFGTTSGVNVTGVPGPAIPEPSSVVLLGTAGVALFGLARLSRRNR